MEVSRELLERCLNELMRSNLGPGPANRAAEIRALLAKPSTAKIDERAAFEAAAIAMGLTLRNPVSGKYWQDIHCGWMMWQARANLEIK